MMVDESAASVPVAAVEDQPGHLDSLDRVMSGLGHKLEISLSFGEGYQRIIEGYHELAFIDVGLDGRESGVELAKRVLETRPYFFAVFYTGQPIDAVQDEIARRGVTQCSIILKEGAPTDEELIARIKPILEWRVGYRKLTGKFKAYWAHHRPLDDDRATLFRVKTEFWNEFKRQEGVVFPSEGVSDAVQLAADVDRLIDDLEERIHRLANAPNVEQIGLFNRVKATFLEDLLPKFRTDSVHARLVVATGLSVAKVSRLDYKGETGRELFERLVDVLKDVGNALREPSLNRAKVRELESSLQMAGSELGLAYDPERLEELKAEADIDELR